MSYLIVDEFTLDNNYIIQQSILIGQRDVNIEYFAPCLYIHNNPPGDIRFAITDQNGIPLELTSFTSISALRPAEPFFNWGFIRVPISVSLKANTNYRCSVQLGNGYFFDEARYVGWVRSDPDKKKVECSYTPNDGLSSAYSLELWERREANRGFWT